MRPAARRGAVRRGIGCRLAGFTALAMLVGAGWAAAQPPSETSPEVLWTSPPAMFDERPAFAAGRSTRLPPTSNVLNYNVPAPPEEAAPASRPDVPIFGSSCGDCLYSEGAASGGLFGSGAYGVHPSLAGLCPSCDQGPSRAVVAFVSYDSWRGVQDGSWQNNGIASGLNFGTRLGRFSDWTGIGFQIGGSAAAYDWAGTDYRTRNQNQAEPQGFVTYGFFRKANESRRVSAALVQDWMINSNFGEFAQNPTLGQWRGQLGYMLSPANEVGVWGTWRLHGDARDVGGANTIWRPINQLNVYSHHKWSAGGPDTWIWLGVPEHDRLAGGGSLGDWLVGLRGNFPLSDAASVYALVTYMHQSGAAGAVAASEDAWNFSVGLAIYPGAMPVRRPWPAAAGCRPFRWPTTATSWSIRTACSSGRADDYGGIVGVCLDAATSGFSGLEEAGYGRAAQPRAPGLPDLGQPNERVARAQVALPRCSSMIGTSS